MSDNIQSFEQESRVFDPPAAFSSSAHIKSMDEYRALWQRSIDDPDGFWGEVAQTFDWMKPYDKVCEFEAPDARWFVGGQTNMAHNCLDRIIAEGKGDKTALLWESEPVDDAGKPEVRAITYGELKSMTCRIANGLKALGVGKGDVVTIYMPMIPEAVAAMLACTRIGAPHSVVFAGFSAGAIADRMNDAGSKVILTSDGSYRRGKVLPLKTTVDEALANVPHAEKCVVFKRCGNDVPMTDGRDYWDSELFNAQPDDCAAEPMDSEDLLFVLYTSGSTGKPKGIMHTTAGYMTYAYLTTKYTFDIHEDDVYWCTADVGWITGHSYIAYGPLLNGSTCLMYEGAPNYPEWNRFWDIVERHKVTVFYTAPTAIRAFMKAGVEHVEKHDLSSLRMLGTVGEPINPEAWMWYHEHIGGGKCPIADTWWQTETGGHMVTPVPGATPTKPGTATLPFFGIDAAIVDRQGNEVPPNEGGLLVIRKPWPSMLRGVLGDRDRFVKTYWSDVPGMYFSGDGARRDDDGYFWIMGRMDDVLNVSGHRLGTAEIESALVAHEAVAESAVVGMPHDVKGEAVCAFVTLKTGFTADDELTKVLKKQVQTEIGAIARPDEIRYAEALPKTRSGKIMRRLLRQVAAGKEVTGDVTTLEDFNVVQKLQGGGDG
ncbi:MAG: acetate--CoA ligase [Planctomycetota bacterium]